MSVTAIHFTGGEIKARKGETASPGSRAEGEARPASSHVFLRRRGLCLGMILM